VARVKLGPRTRNPQPIAVGQHPVGVVVHDGSVWVANRDSSTLSRVDARAMRVRGEVEVPLNPYEIGTDGEALWVTSLALGRLTRVGPP
jgi:streptogramin lyase